MITIDRLITHVMIGEEASGGCEVWCVPVGECGYADAEWGGDDGAGVPCAEKRAARVRSAWGMKVLSPVRSSRW